jgi:uncharacterized linocin/CFP29 family protein
MVQTTDLRGGFSQVPPGLGEQLLVSGGDINRMRAAQYQHAKMRNLAPLWKNTQELIDRAVVRVGREGLVILDDRRAQFSVPLPEWLGVLELTSHKTGESRKANIGMVPGSKPDAGGIQNKIPYTLPIPMIWDTFSFNVRELEAARRVGRPLDTDEVEQAVRNVNFAAEDWIIHGQTFNVTGNSLPGLLDTNLTQAYETNLAWDASTKTGAGVLTDVLAMRAVAAAVKRYGPYTLYVNTSYGASLQKPFDSTGITSISRQNYLENLVFGDRKLRVRTADLLPTNRTLLVQDTSNACDVIVGQEVTAINPAPQYEFHMDWLVYAVIVPRVKSDINGDYLVVAGNTT